MKQAAAPFRDAGLLERAEELDRLRDALAAARAGAGRLVLLEGAPGAGKTALIRAARAEAARCGLRVLAARGSPLERDLAFGVVRQLLATAVYGAGGRGLLRGPAQPARELLLEEPGQGARGDPGPGLMQALYWLVLELTELEPLLMAIDDAHWADDASLDFLHFLAARLEDLPVTVVVATRPAEDDASAELLARLELDPLVDVVRPAPLSEAAVAALLARALAPPEPQFAAAAHAATGGNPFFVRELARVLAERQVAPVAAAAGEISSVGPSRVARWALGRLAGLAPAAAHVARAVAVLGDDAELRHVAELAGRREDAPELAAALARAGVLDDARPLRFAHPILRAAIYNDVPEAERASAHRRAAQVLGDAGAAVDRVASHLVRAEPAGDRLAARTLAVAAERALRQGAPATAAALGRRALAEPPAPDDVERLVLAVAEAELAAGEFASAADRLRWIHESAREPKHRVAVAARLARALWSQKRGAEAVDVLERELRRDYEGEARLMLEVELAHYAFLVPEARRRVPARLERYADLDAATSTERNVLAQLAVIRSLRPSPAEACVPLARRALAGASLFGPSAMAIQSWAAAVNIIGQAEELDEARRLIEHAGEEARRAGAVMEYAGVALAGINVAIRAGRIGEGETFARLAAELSPPVLLAAMTARLAHLVALRGALDEAEEMVMRCPLESASTMFDMAGVASRGLLRLLQGRRDDALADLRAAVAAEEPLGMHAGGAGSMRANLAIALAPVDRCEAIDLAQRDLEYSRTWGARGSVGVSMRALGVALGGDEGVATLREAVALLTASPMRFYQALALLDLGSALRRRGLRQEARDHLRAAADLAAACGAHLIARQAADELRATGARPRRLVLSGVESLTPMERRIAEMAAAGLSNPDIARTLFVTRKNVEMHLSRAYSKLDIRSRAELPTALGGHSSGAP